MQLKDLLKITNVRKLTFKPIDLKTKFVECGNNCGNNGAYCGNNGGIYRMFDKTGEIVYVGKSQNLIRRLKQHLGKDSHAAYFMDEIARIEWLFEPNPIFQNLLEAVFIAYHQPKYNDEVKDAKKKFGDKL